MALTIKEFAARTAHIEYRPKGIFRSEMFAFLDEAQDCDAIIQTGMGYGYSTAILAATWPHWLLSICNAGYGEDVYQSITDEHLGNEKMFFSRCDAINALEYFLTGHDRKTAVLIDGPKGKQALELAKKALKLDHVLFVAIHDLPEELRSEAYFHTHEIRHKIAHLDEGSPYLEKYPNGPGLSFFR